GIAGLRRSVETYRPTLSCSVAAQAHGGPGEPGCPLSPLGRWKSRSPDRSGKVTLACRPCPVEGTGWCAGLFIPSVTWRPAGEDRGPMALRRRLTAGLPLSRMKRLYCGLRFRGEGRCFLPRASAEPPSPQP